MMPNVCRKDIALFLSACLSVFSGNEIIKAAAGNVCAAYTHTQKRDHINYGLIAVSFPFLLFRLDLNQRPSD